MRANQLLAVAISWLRETYPGSIIVTELSVADWGGARIDVAAITEEEVVGVEIKGLGDSPYRLELQGLRYGQVARTMWLLPTPKGTLAEQCKKHRPKNWGMLTAVGGTVQPAVRYKSEHTDHVDYYEPRPSDQLAPYAICGTLWRDELYDIARRQQIRVATRARVADLTKALIESMPVPALHDAMVEQLRMREWKRHVIDTRPESERRNKAIQMGLDI